METLRIITEEHRSFWRMAIALEQVADDLDAGKPVDPAFFQAAFEYIEKFADHAHHRKEDDYLFPLMRQRSADAVPLVEALEEDHRQAIVHLEAMRQAFAQVTAGQPPGALVQSLRDYCKRLKNHIRTEEGKALPLARKILTAEDWQKIDARFEEHNDPLFGPEAQAEFQELYHRVVSLAPESIGLGAHSGGVLKTPMPASGGDVLLKVSGLESSYGRIKALKGLNLEIHRGETVALVGANGAGKTTFLRTLSGVQPMGAGQIVFDGEDISKVRADQRMRRGICQSPEGRQVFGPLSIEDNLLLGAYTQPKQQVPEDLEKVYAMFPILKEKRKLPAGTLSGGQQQMLAIGRALMGRPKLLLLDEPSMGLAPLLVQEVFNVVKALKAQGMTIILAEQNAFAALALADRGYVLETGEITLTGTGQDLIHNEKVRAAYLGM
ncbi:MAG: ATP-binding cassette domain-containing protein [Burkholderiaceae bacterium]|nr:ATP-binding cassette domain-containing protein [Burkholderiaceae bacterium]